MLRCWAGRRHDVNQPGGDSTRKPTHRHAAGERPLRPEDVKQRVGQRHAVRSSYSARSDAREPPPIAAGTTRVLEYNTRGKGVDVPAAGVPAAKRMLKAAPTDADAAAKAIKALGSGVVMTDGKATVTLVPSDTKDLERSAPYYATLRLWLTGGKVLDFEAAGFPGVPYQTVKVTQGAVEAVS